MNDNPAVTAPSIRRRTFEILEVARPGDRVSRVTDISLMVLIAANVMAVILASVPAINNAYATAFYAFELFSIAVFTVEYLARLWCCVEDPEIRAGRPWLMRLRYMVRPLALADLVAILPFWLTLFIGPMDLRFFRVLRLLRIFKLTRYSVAMTLLLNVLRQEARVFGATLFILMVVMILASSGIYLVEHKAQPEAFGSIPAAMWWAVATLTTVGYGDVTPITPWGKMFGACITIVGVGMVALPSGILASAFSDQLRQRREHYEEEVEAVLHRGTITADEQRELDRLREELNFSREQAASVLHEAARRRHLERADICPYCGARLPPPPRSPHGGPSPQRWYQAL